jgi:spermidine synthase
MLRTIVHTFLLVFPQASAFIAHYNAHTPMLGLIGGGAPLRYELPWMARRVGQGPLRQVLLRQEQALYDDLALFGTFLADSQALARFAEGPRNTDDHPVVRFGAPALAYADQPDHAGRLELLLRECDSDPAVLFAGAASAREPFIAALRRSIAARDVYLEGAILALRGDRRGALERYLEAVATSHDFEIAYQVCLLEAQQHAVVDPAAARSLLERLVKLRPDRREAARLLEQMP